MTLTYIEKPKDLSMVNPSFIILIKNSRGRSSTWKSTMSIAVLMCIAIFVSVCLIPWGSVLDATASTYV